MNMVLLNADYILVDEKEKHLEKVSAIRHPIACGIMFKKRKSN